MITVIKEEEEEVEVVDVVVSKEESKLPLSHIVMEGCLLHVGRKMHW